MDYSCFWAKCGRSIMWSHKIQSLWSDLKHHINMTCVLHQADDAVAYSCGIENGITAKWELRYFGSCRRVWQSHEVFVSLPLWSVCFFVFMTTYNIHININGPNGSLCFGALSSSVNWVQRAERKQDCRESARAAFRSKPSWITDVVVRSKSFFTG